MSEAFKRESRYYVLKVSDVAKAGLTQAEVFHMNQVFKKVESVRENRGASQLSCVVVEHDWPEYEVVWSLIEQRMAREVNHE